MRKFMKRKGKASMTESEEIQVITFRKPGIAQQLELNLNTFKLFCKRCKDVDYNPVTDRVYCVNCRVAITLTPYKKGLL